MANQNSSIEEILAACRAADGGGATPAATPAAPTPAAAPATPPAPAAPAAGGASGAKPSQSMSVAEMMAAARGETAGGAAAKPADAAAAAPAPAASGKKPSQSMSVAEMMAAARGETAKGSPAAKKPAAAKAAPAAAASTAAAKKANPKSTAAPAGPRDTSSILAAARKADSDRRGPMSKAEAKEKGQAPKKKVAPPMPEKPAYAKPKPAPVAGDEDRRGFMSILFGSFMAIGFFSLSAVGGLWGLGLARYLFPNILTEPPSQFKIGFPADFPPDSVVTKFKAQFGVWVVNTDYEGQQQITALMSVCTHLGCTPNWLEGEQKFKCPCHGSGFYKEGINFEGPAPRPLERYAIRIADDGQLEIDKSKSFQQEMGDWKDPACFVPV